MAQEAWRTESTALLTDRYELSMLSAALRGGTAGRRCVFEVFTRRLPTGRRFGVVAGTGRVIDAIESFRFDSDDLDYLRESGAVDEAALSYLADYRFGGSIVGYREGELFFADSPILTVTGTFAEAVVLETLILSILNHDSAIASAAARMAIAAGGRPLIEMGARRTHERAAVAAARAAYIGGFASTSNLAAGARYGIPTAGTAAHAFVLLHDTEADAFASQVAAAGAGTTLLVDTYDITAGIEAAVAAAGTGLGAVRIDSGDLAVHAVRARAQLDALGATGTRIIVSGDLDEYSIAALAAAPVDGYGAGTALVTGSGAPTAGLVYKLVAVDGRPVAKRSESKASHGGRKTARRSYTDAEVAISELVSSAASGSAPDGPHAGPRIRALQVALVRDGRRAAGGADPADAGPADAGPADAGPLGVESARELVASGLRTLPWEGLKLSAGDAAIPTVID